MIPAKPISLRATKTDFMFVRSLSDSSSFLDPIIYRSPVSIILEPSIRLFSFELSMSLFVNVIFNIFQLLKYFCSKNYICFPKKKSFIENKMPKYGRNCFPEHIFPILHKPVATMLSV